MPGPLHFIPFGHRDWLSSSRVRRMPLAAQGAYLALLCYQWEDGGLPASREELADVLGVGAGEMARLWPHLEPAFPIGEDGLRRNPRLAGDREEAYRKVVRNRLNGTLGGRPRATPCLPFEEGGDSSFGGGSDGGAVGGDLPSAPSVRSRGHLPPTVSSGAGGGSGAGAFDSDGGLATSPPSGLRAASRARGGGRASAGSGARIRGDSLSESASTSTASTGGEGILVGSSDGGVTPSPPSPSSEGTSPTCGGGRSLASALLGGLQGEGVAVASGEEDGSVDGERRSSAGDSREGGGGRSSVSGSGARSLVAGPGGPGGNRSVSARGVAGKPNGGAIPETETELPGPGAPAGGLRSGNGGGGTGNGVGVSPRSSESWSLAEGDADGTSAPRGAASSGGLQGRGSPHRRDADATVGSALPASPLLAGASAPRPPSPPPSPSPSGKGKGLRDAFGRVRRALDLVAEGTGTERVPDETVRRFLAPNRGLTPLLARVEPEEAAELYLWCARHFPGGRSWGVIGDHLGVYRQQMREGVVSLYRPFAAEASETPESPGTRDGGPGTEGASGEESGAEGSRSLGAGGSRPRSSGAGRSESGRRISLEEQMREARDAE